MKRSRFSEEKIVSILREAELSGGKVRDICRKHGVCEQTFYRWRNKYGGMQICDVRSLRVLKKENARLKKLVAERDLEIDAMKELVSKNW